MNNFNKRLKTLIRKYTDDDWRGGGGMGYGEAKKEAMETLISQINELVREENKWAKSFPKVHIGHCIKCDYCMTCEKHEKQFRLRKEQLEKLGKET